MVSCCEARETGYSAEVSWLKFRSFGPSAAAENAVVIPRFYGLAKGGPMGAAFQYEQYMPHGMCLLWEPWLVLLWAGSDLMIFTAYMAIPFAIYFVMRKRPDLNHRGLVGLFGAFILLCGITHAMGIVTLWFPIYPFTGLIKLATGVVSLMTAMVLFRLIPVLVRIPTPDRHEEVIEQLELALADLSRNRDELEARVGLRTKELRDLNSHLFGAAREAVQRSRNLIQLVSSLTRPGIEAKEYSEGFLRDLRGRINALAIATSTVMEQGNVARAKIDRVIRRQVEPIFALPKKHLETSGPDIEVGTQGAQQISLVAWELASRFAQMSRANQSRGRISVAWSVSRDEHEGDLLNLEWREAFLAGGGGTIESSAAGDGTFTPELLPDFSESLLTQIVPHLLNGKGRIEIAPATFIYRLSCPLSAVESDAIPDFTSSVEAEAAQPESDYSKR